MFVWWQNIIVNVSRSKKSGILFICITSHLNPNVRARNSLRSLVPEKNDSLHWKKAWIRVDEPGFHGFLPIWFDSILFAELYDSYMISDEICLESNSENSSCMQE